jgi:hypothetical protein
VFLFLQDVNVEKIVLCEVSSLRQKLWSSGILLGSRSDGSGFYPRPILGGSGVKAMPS